MAIPLGWRISEAELARLRTGGAAAQAPAADEDSDDDDLVMEEVSLSHEELELRAALTRPYKSLERRACDLCAKQSPLTAKPLQVCGRCGGRRYCSALCQRLDWRRHKARCAKRPSAAGPNKQPIRTKADRDHDAKVRADEQAMAMENFLAPRAGKDDRLAILLSDEGPDAPPAMKALLVTGLRERVASGELSSYVAGGIYCDRWNLLAAEGVKEPVTDTVRATYIRKFSQNEAMWLRMIAALEAVLDPAFGPAGPLLRDVAAQIPLAVQVPL